MSELSYNPMYTQDATELHRMLTALLEGERPAVLTSRSGQVIHVNTAGRQLFSRLLGDVKPLEVPDSLQSTIEASCPDIATLGYLTTRWQHSGYGVIPVNGLYVAPDLIVWHLDGTHLYGAIDLSERAWDGYLAAAVMTMHSKQDLETTLEAIVSNAVPVLGDWCTIDLLEGQDLFLKRAAVWHADPDKARAVAQMRRRYPVTRAEHHPVMRVVTEGEPVFIHEFDDERVGRMTRDETHYRFVQSLGLRASMILPLTTNGKILGAITFSTAESGRLYTRVDMDRAAAYAAHAALAIHNILRYQQADEVSRIREHYLSVASHEIRTPLAVVSGFASLLIRQIETGTPDPDRLEVLLNELRQGVERLESLTEDLLVASSVERGGTSIELEEVDLVALAGDVIQRIRVANEGLNGNIRLQADDEVVGYWSPNLLDRALSNLIGNAVKYSGDEVDVRVTIRQDATSGARVEVSDTGIGISESDCEALFMPFMRGSAARRMSEGTGLGLYITRKIVDQHGGTIDVQSTPGNGSTFTVTLPLRSQAY